MIQRACSKFAFVMVMITPSVFAGGGYFALGYGPLARQLAGATTAVVGDAFAGSSNPAKWLAAGNRFDLGTEFFMPYREIERTGSGSPFDFETTSDGDIFLIPEGAYSRRLSDRLAWGLTVYGNGGLNTEYRGTTGIPGTNVAPTRCGNEPSNFLFGCGKLGVDIIQMVIAPGIAYQLAPKHTLGIAPLLTLQRFEAYGLQAFAAFSKRPQDVTNRGSDYALGAGVRVGWLGELTPWLSVGAAYASRVAMDKFEQYEGLLADGALDIPENYTVGFALKAATALTLSFDYQRINFGDVEATGNGVLNTLRDPVNNALGTAGGSGFNWGNQNNFRFGAAYAANDAVTVRAGYAYGERPNRDAGLNTVTLNMLTPSPEHQVSAGFTWNIDPGNEFHLAYSYFVHGNYEGPSATALLGVGGIERISAHVHTVMLAWTWKR
jgi:long-chain fatty acid transport protein